MKNNFGYLFREGFRGIYKHGFMSFAAVCVMVACLVIIGGFGMISYNLYCMVNELESESEILVYIDSSYTTAEAKSVGTQLSQIRNIRSKQFVSRQEALDNYIASHDDPSVFEGITADTFEDRYVIVLEDYDQLSETVEEIETIEGVSEVNTPTAVLETFNTVQNMLTVVSAAIMLVLAIVSIFIISNTIKLVMYDRQEEIGIMKIVGATNGFIRFPFVIQGVILGLLGGGIAFGLEWGLYELIANRIAQEGGLDLVTVVPFQSVIWIVAIVFGVIGLLIGVFGSLISIRKFMDV